MDFRTFLVRRGAIHRPGARAAVAAAGLALLAMLALAGCTAGGVGDMRRRRRPASGPACGMA